MVTKWGLSEKLGPLQYGEEDGEVFLGHSVTQHKRFSGKTAQMIDEEVRDIIDRNYKRAEGILKEYEAPLHKMADLLIKYETIDKDQINDIMEGREARPPANWSDDSEPPSGDGAEQVNNDEKSSSNKGEIGGPANQH